MAKFDYIEDNLIRIKKKIERISNNCGRNSKEIYLIAVSKTFPTEAVISAIEFNQLDFGENRVQELVQKNSDIEGRILNWHLIGHLQTNKVKYIAPFVFMIHSVDSFKLAQKISEEGKKLGKRIKCLIQVNTSGEDQKSGCEVKDTLKLVKEISYLENIRVKGLMTIAKFMNDEKSESERNIVRDNFKTLRSLYDEIKEMNIPNTDFKYLSMGMSSDYDIAIEEGSNMLRIGSSIFGERVKKEQQVL
ncbi:MAG: YggS family pyridoxal phosphate-dependent enzyme [Ginsengibacter sp.]